MVTGQIGVGKSSELWQFFQEQRQASGEFIIFCDLEKEEHPERCGATGVFLTIFRDCWRETQRFQGTQRKLAQLRDEILTRLIDWLGAKRVEKEEKVVFQFGGMDFPVFLNRHFPDRSCSDGPCGQLTRLYRQPVCRPKTWCHFRPSQRTFGPQKYRSTTLGTHRSRVRLRKQEFVLRDTASSRCR